MSVNVSTLVRYLKNKLDSDNKLQNIHVIGELSNFHRHNSGHLYFTLKDDVAQISCVMFSSKANAVKFAPKNGDKVEVSANVSIFETSGQLQLYINSMKIAGLGDLYQQFEELKSKLNKEGYFLDEHKKTISTKYPEKVCVLVGDKSAAMSDIKTCFLRRWPICRVDYFPVLVQGSEAHLDIINTLLKVDELQYDAIILARGGGSFEDLFCFNNEELVKTIYNLKTFIITGIGHEQDFTLADFVADLRAPTPTACVELITPDIIDVSNIVNTTSNTLDMNISRLINTKKMKLDYYSTSLSNYSLKISSLVNNIKHLEELMKVSLLKLISTKKYLIKNYDKTRLNTLIENIIKNIRKNLESIEKLISLYSIDKTLKRGYSLVYRNSELIKNKKELKLNDDINIKLYGGEIKATVKGV